MKNPFGLDQISELSSAKKDLIIIIFLAFIVFILSTISNFFNLILLFIGQHNSWQLDDFIVISIFLVFALAVFSYRRSLEMKKEIDEKIKAEGALLQAKHKLTILYSITRHDINNQLTALMGYLELLEQKRQDPSTNDYFEKASTAAQHISAMIQFTKEYEKIGVHVPVWQDCLTLVSTAAKQATLGKVMVKNDIPAGTEVFSDPLIVKVFYNLMDNAVRYGGKITTIRFAIEEHLGDHIVICEDDGIGVVTEEKEKIFERGFGKNTGLGLYLAREILSITGITIKETGEPGKGARFEMTVPKGVYRLTDVNSHSRPPPKSVINFIP